MGAHFDDDNGQSSGSAYLFQLVGDDGERCEDPSECESGFCVDGVCCNEACGDGDAGDCVACDVDGFVGHCAPVPAETECRSAEGECDVAEACDGSDPACPDDGFVDDGTACDGGDGACTDGACEPLGPYDDPVLDGPAPDPGWIARGCVCRGVASGPARGAEGAGLLALVAAVGLARRRGRPRSVPHGQVG